MPKNLRFVVPVAGIVVIALMLWWWRGRHQNPAELRLYGNVDLRQVDLPFNASERIAEVLAQEGDRVAQGQVLARLDTGRLAPQLAKAEADLAVQAQAVDRLHHGNRPEEIAQSQANVAAAIADAKNARAQYERLRQLSDSSSGRGVSRQELDSAKAALETAEARLDVNRKVMQIVHHLGLFAPPSRPLPRTNSRRLSMLRSTSDYRAKSLYWRHRQRAAGDCSRPARNEDQMSLPRPRA